jgi:hypothetical protein
MSQKITIKEITAFSYCVCVRWIVGLLDCCIAGLLDFWFAGLLMSKTDI